MAKETGIVSACKRKRMVGLSKLDESDAGGRTANRTRSPDCCKFHRRSLAETYSFMSSWIYGGTFREIGDIIRLFPLSRCMAHSLIDVQRNVRHCVGRLQMSHVTQASFYEIPSPLALLREIIRRLCHRGVNGITYNASLGVRMRSRRWPQPVVGVEMNLVCLRACVALVVYKRGSISVSKRS